MPCPLSILLRLMAIAVGVSIGSVAATANPPADRCSLVRSLTDFVTEQTDYPALEGCPRYVHASRRELESITALVRPPGADEPAALFLPAAGEILLGPEIDLSTALGRSYLVHELVHAHQIRDRATIPCPGTLEKEAYRVQASYLRQEGASGDAFNVELIGLLQAACDQAYHPDFAAR